MIPQNRILRYGKIQIERHACKRISSMMFDLVSREVIAVAEGRVPWWL